MYACIRPGGHVCIRRYRWEIQVRAHISTRGNASMHFLGMEMHEQTERNPCINRDIYAYTYVWIDITV